MLQKTEELEKKSAHLREKVQVSTQKVTLRLFLKSTSSCAPSFLRKPECDDNLRLQLVIYLEK